MKLRTFISITVAAWLLSTPWASAQDADASPRTDADATEGDDASPAGRGLYVDSLSLSFGYARQFTATTQSGGGVSSVVEPAADGWATSLAMAAAVGALPELKFAIDFTRRNYTDRNFSQVGLGARYDFVVAHPLDFYLGAGLNYVFLRWQDPPAPGIASGIGGAESFGGAVTFGMHWYFIEHLGLHLGGRADFFGLDTTVVQGSASTTLDDNIALSALLGLVVRFGEPRVAAPRCPCVDHACNPPSTVGAAPPSTPADNDADGVLDANDDCPDTLVGVPVDERGCPLDDFSLEFHFENAKFAVLSMEERPPFRVVAFLRKHEDYRVHITGHTDDTGSQRTNDRLSLLRAQEAQRFLVDAGIDARRVSVEGTGESAPVVENDTREARAANRRIVARFFRGEPLPPREEPAEGAEETAAPATRSDAAKPKAGADAEAAP